MNTKNQLLCAWCAPAFMVTLAVGFWFVGGFIPPPSPTESAAEIADFFDDNRALVRLGLLLTMAGAALLAPWVAALTIQMKRIEGRHPVLSYTQLAAGALVILLIVFPTMFWTTAAFRPERDPELMLMLNDLSWLTFIMAFSAPVVQMLAIGIAILSDRSPTPVFPRWAGYFNLWVALLLIPGGLVTFFKTGAFAFNGLIAWWLTIVLFFAFWTVMTVLLIQAIKAQAASEGATTSERA